MRGLGEVNPNLRATLQKATRDAVTNLANLARKERVDFVLLAGDIFDGEIQDPGTGQFLLNLLGELARSIPVFLIRGNHDALNRVCANLRWPEGVRQLGSDQAETVLLKDLGVALHGRGFGSRAEEENLAAQYPHRVEGFFNIGLLHTSLTGSDGHNTYAPTTPEQLTSKRYDYWALGHIHKRQLVREAGPTIVFPGNTQGRSIRETGPKGCALVKASPNGPCMVSFADLDTVRWEHVEVDLEGSCEREDGWERIESAARDQLKGSDRDAHVFRVTLRGPGEILEPWLEDRNLRGAMQNLLAGLGRGVCLEKVKMETTPDSRERDTESTEDVELFRDMAARWVRQPQECLNLLATDPEWKLLKDKLGKVFSQGDIDKLTDPTDWFATLPGLYESLRQSSGR